VFVWRANTQSVDATDAWIDKPESGPKFGCGEGTNGPILCDWSDVFWIDFKKRVGQEVPETALRFGRPEPALRAKVLKTLDPRLDPAEPLKGEAEMAQHWAELRSSSLGYSAYGGELFNQLRRVGCAADGAPYVARALIKRLLVFWESPFGRDSPQRVRLAAEFLKEDCAGARGLSEDMKGNLKVLGATSHP
jgi:hypothetical protein